MSEHSRGDNGQQGNDGGDAESAMRAMGLPTTFGAPSTSFGHKQSHRQQHYSPSTSRHDHHSAPLNAPSGPAGMRGRGRGSGGGGGYQFSQRGRGADAHNNKRKRGGHDSTRNQHSTAPGYAHLPLDQIPTDSLIRRSFTEDPWAHLQ